MPTPEQAQAELRRRQAQTELDRRAAVAELEQRQQLTGGQDAEFAESTTLPTLEDDLGGDFGGGLGGEFGGVGASGNFGEPEKPIGFIEAFKERPLEKIPFSPVAAGKSLGLVTAAKRLQTDDYPGFVSGVSEFAEAMEPIGGYTPTFGPTPKRKPLDIKIEAERAKQEDIVLLTKYFEEQEEISRRGYTLGGRVGQITSEMPAFMVEFLTTGGLQKLGSTAAKKGAAKLLGKHATTTAGKAAIATGGFAIGTAIRAAGMPHRAADAILKRQAPQDIKISAEGAVEIIGPVEKPMTSLWKGLADHYIEIASEQAGEVIGPAVNKVFNRLPLIGKLTGALQKKWISLKPGRDARKFAKKIGTAVGFHGVVGEVGEEYLGNITRAIVDVDDFGAGEDANMLERISAGVRQDTENLPAMLIAFSVPGVAGQVTGRIVNYKMRQSPALQKEVINKSKETGVPVDDLMDDIGTAAEAPKIISRFPQKITDRFSLEKLGNAMKDHMGLKDQDIIWRVFDQKSGDPLAKVKTLSRAGDKKVIEISVAKPSGKLVGKGPLEITSDIAGQVPRKAGEAIRYTQATMKRAIVHELGHILHPPKILGGSAKNIVHTEEFVAWTDKMVQELFVERAAAEPTAGLPSDVGDKVPPTAAEISLSELSHGARAFYGLTQQGMSPIEAAETMSVAALPAMIRREEGMPTEEIVKNKEMLQTLLEMEEFIIPSDTLNDMAYFLLSMGKGTDIATSVLMARLEAEESIPPLDVDDPLLDLQTMPEARVQARTTAINRIIKEAQEEVLKFEGAIEADEYDPKAIKRQDKLAEPVFNEPGWFALITNKRKLMQRIGVDRGAMAETMKQHEKLLEVQNKFTKIVNKIIRSLRKQTTLGDRIASRIMKRQTKPVKLMVELLDEYEDLPDEIAADLTTTEVGAFNELRGITRWLLDRTNVVRVQRGDKPIEKLSGYLPHWYEKTAKEIMNKDYIYKSGPLADLMAEVPQIIHNPTAYQRTLELKIEKYMEQNLGTLMRGLISYDIHDIMLKKPHDQAIEEVDNLLKPEDGSKPKISKRAHKFIVDYLNYDILKRQVPIDKIFNDAKVVKTGTQLINKILRPLNREIYDPAASFYGGFRKIMHAAFMPFRPRPGTRNLGQRLLNLSFYRGRDLLRAQFERTKNQDKLADPKTGEMKPVLDHIREQDWYKLTRPMDLLNDDTLLANLTSKGMILFKTAHVSHVTTEEIEEKSKYLPSRYALKALKKSGYRANVETSALTGYYDWKHRLEQSHDKTSNGGLGSKHYQNIVKENKRTGIPIEYLQTQPADMMNDIRDAVTFTQWEYMSHTMPTILRGQTARAAGAYQSWWMNYFTSFLSEGYYRLMTGRTRVRGDGTGGRLLTPGARFRVIKGLGGVYGMAKLVKSTTGIVMLSGLLMPDPTNGLPPLLDLGVLMAQLFLSYDKPEKRKQAWKDLYKFAKHLLPFSNAYRDAARLKGDWTLKEYIFYTENAEWKQMWIKVEEDKTPFEKLAAQAKRQREGTSLEELAVQRKRQREKMFNP